MKSQPLKKKWTIAKLSFGSFFFLLIVAGGVLLNRMAAFRALLEHPESGLFLARVLVLLPMGACLVMGTFWFLSVKIHIKRKALRNAMIVAAIILGAACIIFCLYFYRSTYIYYAKQAGWPLV